MTQKRIRRKSTQTNEKEEYDVVRIYWPDKKDKSFEHVMRSNVTRKAAERWLIERLPYEGLDGESLAKHNDNFDTFTYEIRPKNNK